MKYNSAIHHRRSIRIPRYNYSSQGMYFVTICIYKKERLFGEIINGNLIINEFGNIVDSRWNMIPDHFPHINLCEYIIMPNHIHGILVIDNQNVGAKNFSPLQKPILTKFKSPSKTIGSVIRGFKIGVTKWFRKNTDIYTIWQRNYWEHIIRDEKDLIRIRQYIINNPQKWPEDKYYNI